MCLILLHTIVVMAQYLHKKYLLQKGPNQTLIKKLFTSFVD